MKCTATAAMFLLIPALGWTSSPLDGTWKADLDKTHWPSKPDVFALQNGVYTCSTCVPSYSVKADGLDQAVTGHPYYDFVNVAIIDERTVLKMAKRQGKTVITEKFTVSGDGNTATDELTDSSASSSTPMVAKTELRRVSAGAPGSHAISGSWRVASVTSSDNSITTTFKTSGDSIIMSTPMGQSYTAKLDGSDAVYNGDPGTTSVSVRKIDAHTIEETDKRGARVITVIRWSVDADGRTIHARFDDRLHGVVTNMVGHKDRGCPTRAVPRGVSAP
jgi:hypothetical protein